MTIPREAITGLVLAGGRGSRMGGVDKGLQLHAGRPLAAHALERLRPQVGSVLISANRNTQAYARLGVPVLADPLPDYPGPLAGLLAGLMHCRTPWLVTVPCDTPGFPLDLVARLATAAVAQEAEIALVVTQDTDGSARAQPVFALLRTGLHASLDAYLHTGERRILPWLRSHRCVELPFDDTRAFFNANTLEDLRQLGGHAG
jgi:molybdenum cofactor guanylyltransferase